MFSRAPAAHCCGSCYPAAWPACIWLPAARMGMLDGIPMRSVQATRPRCVDCLPTCCCCCCVASMHCQACTFVCVQGHAGVKVKSSHLPACPFACHTFPGVPAHSSCHCLPCSYCEHTHFSLLKATMLAVGCHLMSVECHPNLQSPNPTP